MRSVPDLKPHPIYPRQGAQPLPELISDHAYSSTNVQAALVGSNTRERLPNSAEWRVAHSNRSVTRVADNVCAAV